MYKDLNDKHKVRGGLITKDYQKLIINFEFRSKPVAFNKEALIEIRESLGNGEIKTHLRDGKYFECVVTTDNENLNYLYHIALIIAYILGQNFKLHYYYKNFPYYTTERYWNLDASSPINSKLFSDLLYKPAQTISFLHDILLNQSSIFAQLVPALLEVNAYSHSEVSFVAEFGLLQKLANAHDTQSTLFTDKKSKKLLMSFSKDIEKLLRDDYSELDLPAFSKKFSAEYLNSRGNTKDKIISFLESSNDNRIKDYIQYVTEWNKMRSSALITHGGNPIDVHNTQKKAVMKELHELLLDLVHKDVNSRKCGLEIS
jgi:hypothetical protein